MHSALTKRTFNESLRGDFRDLCCARLSTHIYCPTNVSGLGRRPHVQPKQAAESSAAALASSCLLACSSPPPAPSPPPCACRPRPPGRRRGCGAAAGGGGGGGGGGAGGGGGGEQRRGKEEGRRGRQSIGLAQTSPSAPVPNKPVSRLAGG
jgi:hypothetical protein